MELLRRAEIVMRCVSHVSCCCRDRNCPRLCLYVCLTPTLTLSHPLHGVRVYGPTRS